MSKKVLMIIAPRNYRDEELEHPKEVFEQNGYEVIIASKGVNEANGSLGGTTSVNIDISEVNVSNYDVVIFVGGPGSSIYFNDKDAHKIVKDAVSTGNVLGSICIATSILANAGVLQNKKVTSFPSEKENLIKQGANYTGEEVTVDEKIITARGPKTAKEFGEKIVKTLEQQLV